MARTTAPPADEATILGHPRGLTTLFTTELWERFSYYGMRAILLLYLTDQAHGLGLGESLGEAVVSIYGASVYLLSVLGGWVSDRLLGPRRTVLYGGSVIVSGHLCLALPSTSTAYAGIALVALGTGLLKPNVSTMVGKLYDPRLGLLDLLSRDQRRRAGGAMGGRVPAPGGRVPPRVRRRRGRDDAGAGGLRARPAHPARRRRHPGEPADAGRPAGRRTAGHRCRGGARDRLRLVGLAVRRARAEAGRRRDLVPVLPGPDRVLRDDPAQPAGHPGGAAASRPPPPSPRSPRTGPSCRSSAPASRRSSSSR